MASSIFFYHGNNAGSSLRVPCSQRFPGVFHVAFMFKNVSFDLMTLLLCPESSNHKLLIPIGFSIASLNKVKFNNNRSKYRR